MPPADDLDSQMGGLGLECAVRGGAQDLGLEEGRTVACRGAKVKRLEQGCGSP